MFVTHPEKKENKGFRSVPLTQYCVGDKIETNEMVGACSSDGGGERRVQGLDRQTWEKETTGETQA
jgi:hypothetical protein